MQWERPYLQLLQPVLTFGLLVRARLGFSPASPKPPLPGKDAMAPKRAYLP